MAIYPVILAGGSGTRLWPISRQNHPKQFLDLLNTGQSMLQHAIDRARIVSDIDPLVVGNIEHRFLLSHQLADKNIDSSCILLEPAAKNTAASVISACFQIQLKDPSAVVLILPADHYFESDQALSCVIIQLLADLSVGDVGVIGINPTCPSTDYGYISYEQVDDLTKGDTVNVSGFIEKPDLALANKLICNQGVAWNSGMVLASAGDLLEEYAKLHPEAFNQLLSAYQNIHEVYDFCVLGDEYLNLSALSFDVAFLERYKNLKFSLYSRGWDDLGTWSRLLARRKSLGVQNHNVFTEGCDALVYGLDDIVLVKGDDVVFAAHQDSLNDVKKLTEFLYENGKAELLNRIDVHRPWGQFKVLSQDKHYIVKRLIVYPDSEISLQSHQYRSEHWVIIKGVALVELEQKVMQLRVGQSITIESGQKHRLRNNTEEPLEIIEVQTGSDLSEDDIVRYEDKYKRHLS